MALALPVVVVLMVAPTKQNCDLATVEPLKARTAPAPRLIHAPSRLTRVPLSMVRAARAASPWTSTFSP